MIGYVTRESGIWDLEETYSKLSEAQAPLGSTYIYLLSVENGLEMGEEITQNDTRDEIKWQSNEEKMGKKLGQMGKRSEGARNNKRKVK